MSLKVFWFSLSLLVSFSLAACSDGNSNSNSDERKIKNTALASTSLIGTYRVNDSFNVGANVFVRALDIDNKSNQLWVGTSIGALSVDINSGSVKKTYTRENGLANEYVFASYAAADGSVWFGTNGGGTSRLKNGKWNTYFPMHGLGDYWVYSFAEQKNKAMWVGTWAGLSRFDYQTEKFATYVKELVNEWVYGLDVDSKGRVWIGTEGGVNMFDGKQWHVWTHEHGLGAPNNRNLDFSTNTGLGTRMRHDLNVLVGGKESYNPNYVFCVKVGSDDSIWVGTWGGGVSHYDGSTWQNLTSENGLAGDIVYSIETDQSGNYWFGTNKGLSVYDGKNWQAITKADGLLESHVYALAVTTEGQVWAGTKNGVAVIESMP